MSTTATERPRTLDQALRRIAELESQLNLRGPGANEIAELKKENASLKSELNSKDGEIRILKARMSLHDKPGAQQPAAQKTPEQMSTQELSSALDAANKRGDREQVRVLWREYNRRKK